MFFTEQRVDWLFLRRDIARTYKIVRERKQRLTAIFIENYRQNQSLQIICLHPFL